MRKYHLLFLLFSISISAQSILDSYENYPFDGSESPLKIRIKFILLQKNDGIGNFNLSNHEEKKVLTDYIENSFKKYKTFKKNNDSICYNGFEFFSDAKIRFEYEILEVKNTYAWNFLNTGTRPEQKILKGFSPTENWYMKKIDDSLSLRYKNKQGIHVYLTMNGERYDEAYANKSKNYNPFGAAAGQFPSKSNLGRSSQIHYPDTYLKYLKMRHHIPKEYKKPWSTVRHWFVSGDARGLAHEIGHVLGLYHHNEYHGRNQCKYSLMSQNGGHPRNYLQPSEIRKIHYNLSSTNLMNFVTLESSYNATHVIFNDEKWTKKRRFYHNFELAKKRTLIIFNHIIVPYGASFKLNKKSKIVFKENGKITYPDGKSFNGWKKHRKSKIIQ